MFLLVLQVLLLFFFIKGAQCTAAQSLQRQEEPCGWIRTKRNSW